MMRTMVVVLNHSDSTLPSTQASIGILRQCSVVGMRCLPRFSKNIFIDKPGILHLSFILFSKINELNKNNI